LSARLAIKLGHDNLEQLIGEVGGAVGVKHVASKSLLKLVNLTKLSLVSQCARVRPNDRKA
jgi:hypothetical protein